jgi:Asp-tRNA(Asn)/Glu-tRNA(Gln) amidotransferase C subunit
LVSLAALELDPAEAEYLRAQLNQQLNALQELAAVPLEVDSASAAHGVPYPPEVSAPPRPDQPDPFPDPTAILRQAPEVADGCFVTPEIPHTALE